MGNPNSPSGLELTIATPIAGNDGSTGSQIENVRELPLMDTFHRDEVGVRVIHGIEIEGQKVRQPIGVAGSSFQARKFRWFSPEQSDMLEASFQQNQFPDKGTKQTLADTLMLTLKQVHVWFGNRRSRLKKHNMEQKMKELDSYKSQVKLLTNRRQLLRHRLEKLKKKINKLKIKQAPSIAAPPPSATIVAEEEEQKQILYVPVHEELFTNGQ